MTCSICNDYKTQIKNAISNRRYDLADLAKTQYVNHLAAEHAHGKQEKEKVRQ